MKTVVLSAAGICVAAGLVAPVALAQTRSSEAALARIEAKWGGVMTKIRGWDADALRQFREGYAGYPSSVLENALAARTFERMMGTLDTHAALLSQQAMEKALGKVYSMGETVPEDAADPRIAEAKRLAAKSLGDDARDLVFIPITPCTVWDTRFASNPDSAGIINNATTKKFYSHLDGAGGSYAAYGGNPGCPETAQNFIGPRPFAVMMTVYINDATGQGWLTLYRDGDPDPSFATISVYYSPGPTRTQTVISKSSRGYGSGTYDIAATSRFANTHASASITGYFVKVTDAGTVTSVGTGPGLSGGPITTSGTIDLAATNLLPTVACGATQIPRWSGSAWSCSADIDTNSGGTVTSVGASAPLASSGGNTPSISLTGTIPVANGGTGATSLTSNGVVYGQGTSAVGTTAGAAGQLLAGTAGAPAFTGSPSISGNLTLVHPSTAVAGNIMKGANRFIHNFGTANTFVGASAGNFTMTGQQNTGSGEFALASNTTGNHNTATGLSALLANTSGNDNTAIGTHALTSNVTGGNNTAVGMSALTSSTAGHQNTGIGAQALGANSTGSNNSALGFNALNFNTTGQSNTSAGAAALASNTTGSNNTASGAGSLVNNTVGLENTASGSDAMASNTTGNYNTASGAFAMHDNTSGEFNTAMGRGALYANTSGQYNTAIGMAALDANTTGSNNTAHGAYALGENMIGTFNTAMGVNALAATNGSENTAGGAYALGSTTTGINNSAFGSAAMFNNTTGSTNVALGWHAAYNLTTGSNNIALGFSAGSNVVSGNVNIHIGSTGLLATESQTIRIGASQSRAFMAGIRGVTTAGAAIPVLIDSDGQLGTVSSSRSVKNAIADMDGASAALMKLRPVTFRYNQQGPEASRQYGLIAEEVARVYPDLVAHSANGSIETVMYHFLPPMLLNEFQKQQRRIEALEKQLAEVLQSIKK
jgi:hypothetical protein